MAATTPERNGAAKTKRQQTTDKHRETQAIHPRKRHTHGGGASNAHKAGVVGLQPNNTARTAVGATVLSLLLSTDLCNTPPGRGSRHTFKLLLLPTEHLHSCTEGYFVEQKSY